MTHHNTPGVSAVHWGLIGCGDIAQRKVGPAINTLDNGVLDAICRRDAEQLRNCGDQLGVEARFTDWQECIHHDSLDAVYLATPVNLHCPQTVFAAENGKHVLCEKPLALNKHECRKMLDACQSNGVHLGVAYYRRFYPVVQRLKEMISKRVVGNIIYVQINAFEAFVPAPDHPRRWILEAERSGGGSLMDFGCHRIEVLLNLLGPVERSSGVTGKVLQDHDVEDSATVVMQFGTGAIASITVIRGGTLDVDTVTLYGTHGTIDIPNLNKGRLMVKNERGLKEETHRPHDNAHLPLIESFTKSLIDHSPPVVDGSLGLQVQTIIDRIYGPLGGGFQNC